VQNKALPAGCLKVDWVLGLGAWIGRKLTQAVGTLLNRRPRVIMRGGKVQHSGHLSRTKTAGGDNAPDREQQNHRHSDRSQQELVGFLDAKRFIGSELVGNRQRMDHSQPQHGVGTVVQDAPLAARHLFDVQR